MLIAFRTPIKPPFLEAIDGFRVGEKVEISLDNLQPETRDRLQKVWKEKVSGLLSRVGSVGVIREISSVLSESGSPDTWIGVTFEPDVNDGYPITPYRPEFCRKVEPLTTAIALDPRIAQEFRQSAIPDRLTAVNVQWIEGGAAIEALAELAISQVQNVTSYPTEPAKKILKQYGFADPGGWITYGTTPKGDQGKIAYFKPLTPRESFEGFGKPKKVIKYETPAKAEALPLMPFVTWETGFTIAQKQRAKGEYQARFKASGASPEQVDRDFWSWWQGKGGSIALTEGFKKALAMTAQGMPAIALRGICNWHAKGKNEQLHEAIAHFATPGRKIYITFDQDEKAKTQINVAKQIKDLGSVLESKGCKVYVPVWDGSEGKGIDDALFAAGYQAAVWFDAVIDQALSLQAFKAEGWKRWAIGTIDRLNRLTYPVERSTKGEYLPPLPPLEKGAIHVLSADMNSGKTVRIGEDWVRSSIAQGAFVVVLQPLNSLGQQTGTDWGLPHIHDFPSDERALWAAVRRQGGIVMCPDSLHRLPFWMLKEPLVLILDEANQVIAHTTEGDTLGQRWSAINEKLAEVTKHAIATGAIVLSEAGLPDRPVDFIQTISDAENVRVFTHKKQGIPWDCTVYHGNQDGFRAELLAAIGQGKKILYVTSSQQEARLLEMALRELRLKVVRIDSETNQQGQFTRFFNSPDQWLAEEQPNVLILSPSAKSGVSIEGGVAVENAYFSQVWGYFSALDTDTHLQLLGRYRPPVPRFMFCPDFVMTSGDEAIGSPNSIQRRLMLNAKSMAGAYGLSALLEADEKRAAHLLQIEEASQTYLAVARTVSGAQKSIARLALIRRLEQAGHSVKTEELEKNKETKELWGYLREEVWRSDAAAIAVSVVTDRHTLEWAIETLGSLEATIEDRTIAHKVLYRSEFPGITFDAAEDCYVGLTHAYGETRRGVLLQARAENLEASKEADREATEGILTDKIRALHRLPKQHVRAALIAETGVLSLLEGAYTNQDKRAIAVKAAALKYSKEIFYFLRLNIKESQTPVEICNKLLKKLGLEGIEAERKGSRGQQIRVYEVAGQDRPVRVKLLEAARRKLSESVVTIRIGVTDPPLQIVTTPPDPPPDPGLRVGQTVRTAKGLAMILEISGNRARAFGEDWRNLEDWEAIAS